MICVLIVFLFSFQMCSKVYCNFARPFNFDQSLLEYMSRHYPEEHSCHVKLTRQHRSEADLFGVSAS